MTRHLAIGDIHGCYRALMTMVDFANITPDDTVITLGDHVNRGPDSKSVLNWLIRRANSGRLVALRGNHEIIMLQARNSEKLFEYWKKVGGKATLRSYSPFDQSLGKLADIPDEHWRFLDEELLPLFETERHFFVHANAYADMPLSDQPDHMLYWEDVNDPPLHESGKIMVCGHTSQKTGIPITNGAAICIDTYAWGGGWLTCLDVDSGVLYQANESGGTRRMHLHDLA